MWETAPSEVIFHKFDFEISALGFEVLKSTIWKHKTFFCDKGVFSFVIIKQLWQTIISNFHRFIILGICWDTPSEKTGVFDNYELCPVPLKQMNGSKIQRYTLVSYTLTLKNPAKNTSDQPSWHFRTEKEKRKKNQKPSKFAPNVNIPCLHRSTSKPCVQMHHQRVTPKLYHWVSAERNPIRKKGICQFGCDRFKFQLNSHTVIYKVIRYSR